jgi:hypothetical protein
LPRQANRRRRVVALGGADLADVVTRTGLVDVITLRGWIERQSPADPPAFLINLLLLNGRDRARTNAL